MSSTPTPSRFSPQVPGLEAPAFSDVAQYASQVVSPQSTKTPFRRKSLAPSLNVDAMEENGVESIPGANVVSRLLSVSSQRSKIAEEQKKKRNEFVSLFSNRLTREFRHHMTFPVVQSDGKMHLPLSRHTVTEDDIVELKATLEKSSSSAVAKDAKDARTSSTAPPEGMFPQTDWWDGRLPPIRGAGGIMNSAMRTLTLANRQTEAHVTLRAARDISGWFFHDVSENTFLAKEVVSCLSDHVDISLRLSGLIKQMGSYKTYTSFLEGTPVVYDEASWTWVSVASRVPIAGGKPDRQSLVDRLDLVPTGIISVVGNLDIGDLTDDVMASKKPSREAMRQKRKANHATAGSNKTKKSPANNADMKKIHDERPPLPPQSSGQPCQDGKKTVDFGPAKGDENHNAKPLPSSSVDAAAEFTSGYDIRPYDNDDKDEQMIMVIGDPDSEFLSTAEVLKYIKHYLTRAVVKAARTAGASIICDGTGDIARQLSLGYQAFLDPVGIKGHKAAVNTQLVGVSARCHSNIVSLDVSHNVLLQCDSGHTEGGPTCGNCFKEHEGFCQGNADYERLKAMSVLGSVAHPTPDAIRMFKLRMLESLHNGHHQQMIYQDSDRSSQAPNRDAIPIMIIVFGGATDVTRREVHTAAQRGWPILIVEGSGGYADILCSTINKINVLSPDASSDDYRRLLTTVDPETSAIIANGSWQIIQRGLEVSQVERLILTALKGDEILHQAWKWYSSWYFNQLQWAYYHQLQQLTILMLGIFATLASVTQTFLILLFRERSTNSTFLDRWGNDDVLPDEKYWYMMFRILQWLVIGLPITLTLVHAVFQRMNPWAKVSAFRVAASSLLCEIYMYRTRTLGYSTEAVKRNRSGATNDNPLTTAGKGAAAAMKMTQQAEEAAKGGGAKHDAKIAEESSAIGVEQRFVYNSREELLGHRMRKIQMTLGASEAGLVRLEENIDKNIPPSDITKNGDGGLADLSPDAYVKFRVSTLRREYWKRHRSLDRQQSMLTALVIFFGATGTALAALSAYGLGYLQAWVAFSTVVVNSLTRFLDFTRISAMAELCNTAEHQLGSVERWWSSVGTDADSDRNRMKLVSDAEHAIRSELEGWSKQMQSMDDDDEAEAAQGAADARADAQHVDDAAVEESKALGTDLLKSDTIYKSLQDSGGNLALKVRRQILDLNDKLGGFIKPPPGPEKAGNASDPTLSDDMNAGPLSAGWRGGKRQGPSFTIPQVFLDHHVRAAFLDLLKPDQYLDYRSLSGFSLRQSLCLLSSQAAEVMGHIKDTLHVTAIGKRMILDQFEDEFQTVLDAIPAEVRNGFTTEEFATAMARAYASFASQLRYVTKESLAQILDHVAVKEAILLMKLDVFQDMIHKCIVGFALRVQQNGQSPLTWKRESEGSLACLIEMLKGVATVEAFERIHVRILNLGSEEETRHVARMIDLLNAQCLPLDLLSRTDLIALVPPGVFPEWRALSGIQLSQIMRVIACGTAASRCVRASRVQLEAQTRAHQRHGGLSTEEEHEGLLEWINEPTRREVLVSANEFLTQLIINRSTKTDLIRAMQATKTMTKDFADSLNAATSEHSLKGVLSTLQAQQSNSFSSAIVQRLADSFFLVDYNDLLSGDEVECLVTSVSLIPPTFAVGGMPKEDLLNIVPLPTLRRHLEGLDEDQLRRLYLVQRLLLSTEYSSHVWSRTQELGGIGTLARQHIMRTIHIQAAQRLIFRVTYMSLREMQDFCQFLSLSKLLQQLGDAVVTQALFGVCVDPTQEHNYATELGRIIEDVYNLTHVIEELGATPTAAVRREDSEDENEDEDRNRGPPAQPPLPQRTSHPLLVRTCHSIRTLQGKSAWVDLFFRMDEDYLSVDFASLNRLVDMKADKLHLIDLDDENIDASSEVDNVGVDDLLALFALDSDPTRIEDYHNLHTKLMEHRTGEYVNALRVKQTLVEMDIFLDLEFPYLMFEEIAQMCTQFDLRDVVVNSTDRHIFSVSWLEFLIASDENVRALCDVSGLQLVDHDADLAIPSNKVVAEEFKSRLLGALAKSSAIASDAGNDLRFGDMDLLLSSVRSLHDAHVVQLAVVIDTLFRSAAGLVFQWYCDNRRQRAAISDPLDLDEPAHLRHHLLSLEQVASHVLCIARGNRSSVEEALCRYDANQFYHTRTSKRIIGVLRQTIPNDIIVNTLLRMDVAQLNWLFIMIQFTLDGEQRCMKEDEVHSKLLKKRFAEKLKSGRFHDPGTRVLTRYLNESPTFEDDFN